MSQGTKVIDGEFSSAGAFEQITGLDTAKGFVNRPVGATFALVQAEDQAVRWRDDGGTPTASVGMLLNAGETLEFNGDMAQFKAIEVAASAQLNVSYYK